ncbi:MAG: hypothetical protein ACJA08_001102 [Cyclobacteriaceae bacterium]|jgi:hypothetical protein
MILYVQNINDSLVFYRQLFNRMPTTIGLDSIHFQSNDFQLELQESENLSQTHESHFLQFDSAEAFDHIYERMKRFLYAWPISSHCETLKNQFSIKDPDGYKWIISNGIPLENSRNSAVCFNQSFN